MGRPANAVAAINGISENAPYSLAEAKTFKPKIWTCEQCGMLREIQRECFAGSSSDMLMIS